MTNKPAVINPNHFAVDMPHNAPALGFDWTAATFSWRDVMPSNYWNLDLLDEKIADLGGNPIVTPRQIVIQPVLDPERDEKQQDLKPKIVLYFHENVPALVFNVTRCNLAARITGTRNPALWAARLPKLELYPGAEREFAAAMQILFRPAPATEETSDEELVAFFGRKPKPADVNDELFG